MTVTREQLAAWVDGELDEADAAAIAAAVAANPALAEEAAKLRALREQLSAHFAPILDQPVPDRLTALFTAGSGTAEVVDFTAARQRAEANAARLLWTSHWLRYGGPAIAAALVLAVVLRAPGAEGNYAQGPLVAALDNQLGANQPADAPVRMLLSFANAKGELCRGYAGATESGLACRDNTGWRFERKFAGSAGTSTDYRQAGSEAELMAAIQDLTQGEPLDAAGEAAAKAKGWRR